MIIGIKVGFTCGFDLVYDAVDGVMDVIGGRLRLSL